MAIPRLSVIMTNYNHARYLAEALNAIVKQSSQPFEFIVCDDGSTDNSVEIIQQFVDRYSFIRFIKNSTNIGIFASFDKLITLVSGDYLYCAAADDKILPGFFEKSMDLLRQYPQAGLCSARTLCMDAGGRVNGILHMPVTLSKSGFIPKDKIISLLYKYGSWIQGNTTIFRMSAFKENGGHIWELNSFWDGFISQVIAAKYGACFICKPLVAWRQLEGSYSATSAKDPAISIQSINFARNLMATKFNNVFSVDFIDRWAKREFLNYWLANFYSLENDLINDLSQFVLVRNLLDRFLLKFRKVLTKVEHAFLKFYLCYRTGLPAGQLIIQRIRYWFLR